MRRQGEKGICGQADIPSSHRTERTTLGQTLWVTAQVVAERDSWVRGQCEHLEELSQELDCVKGLAWPRKAMGAQDAKAQVSSAALLSQEALRTVQVVATLGGPESLLGQAQEARRWTEQLLWATGRPRGPAVLRLKLKGLVDRVQRLSPRLLGLLDKAGVVGGNMGHWGMFCQGEDSLLGLN